MAYSISVTAEEQIIKNYQYGFTHFGEVQAEKYLEELYHCFELLSENPRMANARTGYKRPIRVHHHAKHYIIYIIEDGTNDIHIIAILREESDLTLHLE